MGKYFGTDGFRGEANVDLTADQAYKIGKFLGYFYAKKKDGKKCRIAIGKDTRRSSYMYEYAVAAGITSTGADALLLHVTTTPSVSYVVRTEGLDAGVMISASHNPYTDNGIKIIDATGEKLSEDIILKIEDYIDNGSDKVTLAKGNDIGRTFDFVQGRNRYIGYLISIPIHSFKNMKVALDTANGSSFSIAKAVFDALGAETYVINNEPNGNNINNNAGSTHIEGLCKFLKENKCDVGFAFDGDADRCIAVDNEGNVVDGDKIMYVCAKYMKDNGLLNNNKIVTTVMSNMGLYKSLDNIGIRYEKVNVGDKYVSEAMNKTGISLGGEQSGHIIFLKHAMTGDGILTSLKVMDTIIDSKKSLKELASQCIIYPQVLKNVKVKDKNKCIEDKKLLSYVDEIEKEMKGDGRVLIRASGTEDLVRVMAEYIDKKKCEEYVDRLIKKIEELEK